MASQLLTRQQLLAELAIDAKRLAQWLKAGLPCQGKGKSQRFDAEKVLTWLLDKGFAQKDSAAGIPSGPICTTRAEAARALGVDIRTLAEWLNDPSFPGKAGSPGRSDGNFPIGEIQTWRAAKFANATGGNEELTKLRVEQLQTKVEREKLELSRELGTIIDAEDVRNLIEASINTAKSILDQLPEQILANLPGKLPKELKRQIRDLCTRKVHEAYEALEGMSTDEDEEEARPAAATAPAAKRTKKR